MQSAVNAPASENPEDDLYQHIQKAEAIRHQLEVLQDAYMLEMRIIESLENQVRAKHGVAPLNTDLNHVLFRSTTVDQSMLPPPRAFPN
jgi:hypothetical protein